MLQQHFHCFHTNPYIPRKKKKLFIILPFAVQATEPEIKRVVANQQQYTVHSIAHKELLSTAFDSLLPPFNTVMFPILALFSDKCSANAFELKIKERKEPRTDIWKIIFLYPCSCAFMHISWGEFF